jgi:large subunit ribosomal protein L10
MDRTEKEQLAVQMRDSLEAASLVIVTQQSGMTVAQATSLRRDMCSAGAEFKVLKNTIARIAVKGTSVDGITSMLVGPTALAYSADPIAAAKVVAKFSGSNDQLKIVGGILNGQILDATAVKALATLPSLDELRAKIIGVISAPATKLAVLSKEPAARIARVLAAKQS